MTIARAMIDRDASIREVAAKLGVDESTLRYRLKRPAGCARGTSGAGDGPGMAGRPWSRRCSSGSGMGANHLWYLLRGGSALRREVAPASLSSIAARSTFDTNRYYIAKATLYLRDGDSAKLRAIADSAVPLNERL